MNKLVLLISLVALMAGPAFGQRGFGQPKNLPTEPVTAAIPAIAPNTGPGEPYDSSPGQWPGYDMAHYHYVADEYVITGSADGEPYKTRLVIRRPEDMSRFSGLVIMEPMHPAGFAHGFEHNSVYIMDAGHIAVEVTTMGLELAQAANRARYADHVFKPNQTSEVLAQVGALIQGDTSPIAGQGLRHVILFGTSATSYMLTQYLAQAHGLFKLANGDDIFDGFLPTSNGTAIKPVNVPMIQMPTQHEYSQVATAVQDGDEPGNQFRVYEVAGIGHLMARHNVRITPGLCEHTPTNYPLEPGFSLALHHLFQWVDKGIIPPRADRVLLDRNVDNDGSLMVLDEHGNPVGGIRNPWVDVPVAKYIAGNTLAEGQDPDLAAVCRLSIYEEPFSRARLRQLYGNKANYQRLVEEDLNKLEAEGWSLPVYHELIMADARKVEF